MIIEVAAHTLMGRAGRVLAVRIASTMPWHRLARISSVDDDLYRNCIVWKDRL